MSPGPSSRANAPKPRGEAALEPKALRRATELPVPQAAVGCAVCPAGRWRVTRQVALRIRYPKPSGEPQPPPNWSCEMGLSEPPKGLSGPPGPLQGPPTAFRRFRGLHKLQAPPGSSRRSRGLQDLQAPSSNRYPLKSFF